MPYKWKGRKKEYHREYMRNHRKQQKETFESLKKKAEKYDLLFGLD